jgi:hypothetical protein
MIRNVAVLADVHGVLPVLDAVLAAPEVRAADRIVVCGDLAAGPQPVKSPPKKPNVRGSESCFEVRAEPLTCAARLTRDTSVTRTPMNAYAPVCSPTAVG